MREIQQRKRIVDAKLKVVEEKRKQANEVKYMNDLLAKKAQLYKEQDEFEI